MLFLGFERGSLKVENMVNVLARTSEMKERSK